MPSNNRVILAAAGARKTESIIRAIAESGSDRRILITTYTIENAAQISERITRNLGTIPRNVTVKTWFTFLLNDWIKPYQNFLTSTNQVRSLNFKTKPLQYARKADIEGYYLDGQSNIFSDNAADFAVTLDQASNGKVLNRLEGIYDEIYIDEVQDLVGYDLDLLDLLIASDISLTIVGDPRQSTYTTSNTRKYSDYQRLNLYDWFKEREAVGQLTIDWRNESFRCNQEICDFADDLYPSLPRTTSRNTERTTHDGIFQIGMKEVHQYMETYEATVLRYKITTNTLGYPAINFGQSKGRTYDRVLIFPTNPMKKYLQTNNLEDAGDIAKFYVAVTRARYSVAFVV
ncbi:UvrD-helicase domain-containing protein [Mycobacteroides abscessus]|uniref:UvrD-helicase domain-containing protein n=1 Tax=Mycobacteroides abscessus TaxID=36809 RepID=UPI000C264D54|nr:UvrD-helicase domain-containing protein [Mycobacteroides abscessus]